MQVLWTPHFVKIIRESEAILNTYTMAPTVDFGMYNSTLFICKKTILKKISLKIKFLSPHKGEKRAGGKGREQTTRIPSQVSWFLPEAASSSPGVPSSTVASSTFTRGTLPFSEGSAATFWGSFSGSFLSGSTLASFLTGRMLPGDRGRTWAGAALTDPGGKEDAGLGVPGKWGRDLDGSLGNKQTA